MAESDLPPQQMLEARHELSDLSPKHIALFGIGLAVTVAAALWVGAALFQHYSGIQIEREPPPTPVASSREPPPGPRLLANPSQDLQTMRAGEEFILKNYGWIDRQKGIVRIPIDRAIDMLAQKGLPARAEPNAGQKTATSKSQPVAPP